PVNNLGASQLRAKVNPLFPVTPDQYPEQQQPTMVAPTNNGGVTPIYSPPPATQPAPPTPSAPPTYNTAPAASPSNNSVPAISQPGSSKSADETGSLEDQLGVLEGKVYGKKHDNLTLVQRIEHMEKDLTGKSRNGTI